MEPKFIISKKVVLEKYKELGEFSDLISYSSKTNQVVTKILEENTDSLFSVHFVNELKHVKNMSRVLFIAQGWNDKNIQELLDKGIKAFVVDNEYDLDKVINFLENNELKNKIDLLLRLKLKENTIRTEKHFVFGMFSEIINKRIPEIKNNEILKNKINNLGVHFHRKTQNMAEWNLKYEISQTLTNETLNSINLINIGGGLPSEYANTNVNVIGSIKNKILDFKKYLNDQNIQMIIEPGRFIAAPSGKLITEIIGIYENNIIVNASVYNSDMDAIAVPVKLKVENELTKNDTLKDNVNMYAIKGVTPCSMDLFRYRVYLETKNVGDQIVFLNAGAYNFSSDFCDLEPIKTEVVEDF